MDSNLKGYPQMGELFKIGLLLFLFTRLRILYVYFTDCSLPNYISKDGNMFAVGPAGETQPLVLKGVNWYANICLDDYFS